MTTVPELFCNCYVLNLDLEDQFSLHYGAHSISCPVYKKSSDPEDDKADCMYRALNEPTNPQPEILNPDITLIEAARMARERGHILQFNGSEFVLAPALLPGFFRIIGNNDSCFYSVIKKELV